MSQTPNLQKDKELLTYNIVCMKIVELLSDHQQNELLNRLYEGKELERIKRLLLKYKYEV